jgi:hypothetical protein
MASVPLSAPCGLSVRAMVFVFTPHFYRSDAFACCKTFGSASSKMFDKSWRPSTHTCKPSWNCSCGDGMRTPERIALHVIVSVARDSDVGRLLSLIQLCGLRVKVERLHLKGLCDANAASSSGTSCVTAAVHVDACRAGTPTHQGNV